MAGVNKWIGIGYLGNDPEVRHLENGKAVANFSIACSESYKNKQGERVTNTEWIRIVLWSTLAEIAEKYLKKGSQVYIEGKLTSRSYQDNDGITKYISEVVGKSLNLIGGNSSNQNTDNVDSQANQSENSEVDELPF